MLTKEQEHEAIELTLRRMRAEAEEAEAKRDKALAELRATVSVDSGEYADAIDEIEAAEIGDEITVQRCHKELARAVRGAVKR